MNRFFRRSRRINSIAKVFDRLSKRQPNSPQKSQLQIEPLENRLLLTTITLPEGSVEAWLEYADAEENEPGSDTSTYNEIRVGTLSGMPASQDVQVEVLNFVGGNISGNYYYEDANGNITFQSLYGGPSGASVFTEVGDTNRDFHALATNASSETYGISTTGVLYRIYPGRLNQGLSNSVVRIGDVIDTDAYRGSLAESGEVTFTSFEAADFDPVSGLLYAVVTGATDFGADGEPITYGEVLITIDTTDDGDGVAEVTAVGRNAFGIPDYSYSQVGVSGLALTEDDLDLNTDTLTIVYSQYDNGVGAEDNAGNNGTRPVFIGYDASDQHRFTSISVEPSTTSAEVNVVMRTVTEVDEDVVITGAMFAPDVNGDIHLFATQYVGDDPVGRSDVDDSTTLVVVNLGTGELTEITTIENNAMEALSFDRVLSQGYASDDDYGWWNDDNDFWNVVVNNLSLTSDDGDIVFEGGVSDVYLMYISSSYADIYITMTSYTVDDSGITYQPQGGEAAFLYVDDDDSDVTTPDEAGGVMIGTVPYTKPGEDDIIWWPETFFDSDSIADDPGVMGVYPGGDFRPGIVVATDDARNPQDIGLIQVGGGIFGDIIIHGSIGKLYAGYLGTNRIDVDGDVGTIIVGTQAGGIAESDNSWRPADNAIMNIGGELSNFHCLGDWGLPIRVQGRSDAPSWPGVLDVYSGLYVPGQREIERKTDMTINDFSYFPWGSLDTDGGYIMVNDTPQQAEYLGTVDDKIVLFGNIEWEGYEDIADCYSFGVMAGQTIEITMYYTGLLGSNSTSSWVTGHPDNPDSLTTINTDDMLLYDPNLRIVGRGGEAEIDNLSDMKLTFTAEEAGIYTISIEEFDIGIYGYRLEIEGVSKTTLGGGNIEGDMRYSYANFDDLASSVQVMNGNMGALSVNGIIRGADIRVNTGDIAAVRAGFGGEVPVGFNWEIDDVGTPWIPHPLIEAGGNIGAVTSIVDSGVNVKAGGDLQLIRMDANFAGLVAADGNIGVFEVYGDYGPNIQDENGTYWTGWSTSSLPFPPGIFANADGEGDSGVIDCILVGGDFGRNFVGDNTYQAWEVPVSVGGRGGNVRYVQIDGAIMTSLGGSHNGGGFGPFTFEPGQSVTIIDDSGALVKISPGYSGESTVDDIFLDTTTSDTTDEDTTSEGGVLSITVLPVRDVLLEDYQFSFDTGETILGYAISRIESTDGVKIESIGGDVEIGVVDVIGENAHRIDISGKNSVSVLHVIANNMIYEIENETQGDMVFVHVETVVAMETGDTSTTDDEDPIIFESIKLGGNLGLTTATTGQAIGIFWGIVEGEEPNDPNVDPIGIMNTGLVMPGGVNVIEIAGSLGNAHIGGNINRIVLNSDESNKPGQFGGIVGTVLVTGDLGRIYLGDGLLDPGRGDYALSGLFVRGSIGDIYIEGPGNDIAGPIFAGVSIDSVNVSDGARIVGYNGIALAMDRVSGVGYMGVNITVSTSFDDFIDFDDYALSGPIGSIEITGDGSEIWGGLIRASSIDNIKISGGAEGMFYSRIDCATVYFSNTGFIDNITVGGAGIQDSMILAGREIGTIKVTDNGTIDNSEIRSSFNVGSITVREINNSDISAYNELNKVTVSGDVFDLEIEAGELGTLKVGGDMLGSAIFVGGPVKSIQTGGDLISTIEVTGPYGDLKKIKSGGDIGTPTGGEIIVDGVVGSITAEGDFLAGLLINWDPQAVSQANPQGPHAKYDIDGYVLKSLKVGGEILGLGDIGGDVGKIQSGEDFGREGSDFRVHGDFKSLTVGSKNHVGDIESSITVDGDLGTLKVYGAVNNDIDVFGDFKSLVTYGSSQHRGDVNGDISVGGDFGGYKINEGNFNGDLNVEGKVGKLITKGGDETANSFASMRTSYTATAGGDLHKVDGSESLVEDNSAAILTSDSFKAGVLDAKNDTQSSYSTVQSAVGTLASESSDIVGEVTIDGGGGIEIDGSILGTYHSTDSIDTLHIYGDIAVDGVLLIEGDLDELIVEGSILGTVRVTGSIGSIVATNVGDENGAAVSVTAGRNIDEIEITDTMANSFILAGFDPGENLIVDGTAVDASEYAAFGNIGEVTINIFNRSVIAAGVSPGVNTVFGDLDGSDTAGVGISTIDKVYINVIEGDGTPFGIFADTQINQVTVEDRDLPVPIMQASGFRVWTVAASSPSMPNGQIFEAGTAAILEISGKTVKITLSGDGVGEVLAGNNCISAISLNGTTSKTKVKISVSGGESIDITDLFTSDDGELGQLCIDGRIYSVTGDASLNVDGSIGSLELEGVGAGSELFIGGDAGRVELGTVEATSTLATSITIAGSVDKLTADDIMANSTISTGDLDSVKIDGDLAGVILGQGNYIDSVSIKGDLDYDGVISSEGGLYTIKIKGDVYGGIRAAEDIDSFQSGSLYTAVIAAGGNFHQAKIKGDVTYSTIASGLDTGTDAHISLNDISGHGDLDKVTISGDFIQSNIVAGVAAGVDGMFGTGDDLIESRVVEDQDAPQVVNVTFPDLYTINVEFREVNQTDASSIGQVIIKGEAEGSGNTGQSFAIIAAGDIESVMINRIAFAGDGNLIRSEVSTKDIDGSTLEVADITSDNAQWQSFQLWSPGFDLVFDGNDVIIAGDNDSVTDPTVWVTYDAETNTASYHNSEGFATNKFGANYFKVVLKSNQITNRNGVALDGEFDGSWPSGDGEPGGEDFEYYFAVADVGGGISTSYEPFAQSNFPTNRWWNYRSQTGDDLNNTTDDAWTEEDLIRLTGLEAGQIINVIIADTGFNSSDNIVFDEDSFSLRLLYVEEENAAGVQSLTSTYATVIDANALENLSPVRDMVAPSLDELAFVGGTFYGYEDQGKLFYTIDQTDMTVTLLENTLDDFNSLIAGQGTILGLKALTGRISDSIWAIADFRTFDNQQDQYLVRIDRISGDFDASNTALRPSITLYNNPVGYDNITALSEFNGQLYAVDANSNTLLEINKTYSVVNETSGVATAIGNGIGLEGLVPTGLSVSDDGSTLLLLHDQPADSRANLEKDALFVVDVTTGTADSEPWQTFDNSDLERHGMAIEPGGAILIAIPLRESPIGDTIEVSMNSLTPIEHTFGSDVTNFGNSNWVDSRTSTIPANAGFGSYINGGYYYGVNINYAHGAGYDQVSFTISDVEWQNESDYGTIVAVADDSDFVQVVRTGAHSFRVDIDAESGDGDVKVYFAGSSMIESLAAQQVQVTGPIIGEATNDDLIPTRDTILTDMSSLTFASSPLAVDIKADISENLRQRLALELTPQQMNTLETDLTSEFLNDVETILVAEPELYADLISSVTWTIYDGLAYDSLQDTFMLYSTTTLGKERVYTDQTVGSVVTTVDEKITVRPMTIIDPDSVTDEYVVLDEEMLTELYHNLAPSLDFSNIRGLEFGEGDSLYAVVTVTDTANNISRDSLLIIDDITDPDPIAGMHLSVHDLSDIDIFDNVTNNITSLAYGNASTASGISGLLFGIDSATQSLVVIDAAMHTGTENDQAANNVNYGKAEPIGGSFDNLGINGSTTFDVTGLDFDVNGRLFGIENNSDSLVEFTTETLGDENTTLMRYVESLPTGADYTSLTFAVETVNYYDFYNSVYYTINNTGAAGFLSRSVQGTPQGDEVTITLATTTQTQTVNHSFGNGSNPQFDTVTISTAAGNTQADIANTGGFYRFDITYQTDQGDIILDIADIDWLIDGTQGTANIDSVFLTNNLHASLLSLDSDSMSIIIDTDQGSGQLAVYFGSTADMLRVATSDTRVSQQVASSTSETMQYQVTEDGDYILNISGLPATYDLKIMVFDDGNSDFGIEETPNGYLYDQVVPYNEPVDLGTNSPDLSEDPDDPGTYTYRHEDWPIYIEGIVVDGQGTALLDPGIASSVIIDAELGCLDDVDVFTLQLAEGQYISINAEAETLYGRDVSQIMVAIYNADLEAIASISNSTGDDAMTAADSIDPNYAVQAAFEIDGHEGIVIDPNVDGLGTYYVVVSMENSDADLDESIAYRLRIETTDPEPIEEAPSQLVYLNFNGGTADYFTEYQGVPSYYANRPAFDAEAFDLANMRSGLIQEIAARIEQIYRDAGLTEQEIEFTTTLPAAGTVYSEVLFGGRTLSEGLFGLAENIDRHNYDRTDQAIVLTDELATFYMGDGYYAEYYGDLGPLSEDGTVRFDQVATLLANIGAHELGHILGLEHATEVDVDEPNNLMGYNDYLEPQVLTERNDYWYQSVGFTNEIDLLLRNIGSGTVMGR